MSRRNVFTAAMLLIVVSGCTTVVVDDPRPAPLPLPGPGPEGSCVADNAAAAVGQIARAGVVERATLASGARTARLIRPGQAYTQEFNPDRLNIEVDAGNRIVRLSCG